MPNQPPISPLGAFLKALDEEEIRCILIGMMAAVQQGAPFTTIDYDFGWICRSGSTFGFRQLFADWGGTIMARTFFELSGVRSPAPLSLPSPYGACGCPLPPSNQSVRSSSRDGQPQHSDSRQSSNRLRKMPIHESVGCCAYPLRLNQPVGPILANDVCVTCSRGRYVPSSAKRSKGPKPNHHRRGNRR